MPRKVSSSHMNKGGHGSRVTLKDIARTLGLSHAAVSLALRDSPEIAKATCQRVQKAARDMGYQPNPMATGLAAFKRTSKTLPVQSTLAWINAWPEPKKLRGYQEFDLYWKGAVRAAEKFGYRLEEFLMNKEMSFARIEKILHTRAVNGILIPPWGGVTVDWDALHWGRFTAVQFGRTPEGLPFHSVTADQRANSLLSFRKIRERGYKRIGFVGERTSQRVFVAGFLQAQLDVPEEARLPPLLFPTMEISENRELFAAWLEKNKPDAIFTETAALPRMLADAGYRVPEDIGLAATGLLDIDVDSGINQHSEEIGHVAVQVLISIINNNDRGAPPIQREILVKGTWVNGSTLPHRPMEK
jgi:LacI family transcriptional regulator